MPRAADGLPAADSGGASAPRRAEEATEDATSRAGNRHFSLLSALAPIQKHHTKPIYCGEREGRLTAPGEPGREEAAEGAAEDSDLMLPE